MHVNGPYAEHLIVHAMVSPCASHAADSAGHVGGVLEGSLLVIVSSLFILIYLRLATI